MFLIVNDSSVNRQWVDADTFIEELSLLQASTARFPLLRANLKVSRNFVNRIVLEDITALQAISKCPNASLRSLLIRWLANTGPFFEDDDHLLNGVFEFEGVDISGSGLEHSAKLAHLGCDVLSYSFAGGDPDFSALVLKVDCLTENGECKIDVPNTTEAGDLEEVGRSIRAAPTTWSELLAAAPECYPNLIISGDVIENKNLTGQPFEGSLANGFTRLMSILNVLAGTAIEQGQESEEFNQIFSDFFTGERAPFSPESDTNKKRHKAALTFPDPCDDEKQIFAHWHGKVSHRYFRLHFEWPMPQNQGGIKVLYFGPKLTKD